MIFAANTRVWLSSLREGERRFIFVVAKVLLLYSIIAQYERKCVGWAYKHGAGRSAQDFLLKYASLDFGAVSFGAVSDEKSRRSFMWQAY